MTKNITLIQFSSRNPGNCASIIQYLEDYYDRQNTTSYTIDDQTISPCNHCDYECLKPGMACPNLTQAFAQIMERITDADLTFFVIPNYCGNPGANYYAFNERSVGYFNGDRQLMGRYMSAPKVFIFVSNSERESFMDVIHQQSSGKAEILYLKSSQYGKHSIAGDILESDAAKHDLKAFLDRIIL